MGSPRRLLLLLLAAATLVAFALWAVLHGGGTSDAQRERPAQATELPSAPSALDSPELRAERDAQAMPDANAPSDATEDEPASPHAPDDGLWLCLSDSSGAGVRGVTLEVSLELWRTLGEEHDEKYQEETVTTDAAGRARIAAHFPEEIDSLQLSGGGDQGPHAGPPFETWPSAPDEVHLLMPSAARVRGRVLDQAGQPVSEGAIVELEPQRTAPRAIGLHEFASASQSVACDEQGGFAFETSCGWFTLAAAAPGKEAAETLTFALDAAKPEIEVLLCVPSAERRVVVRIASTRSFEPKDVWVGARGTIAWPAADDAGGRILVREHAELRCPGVQRAGPVWLLELPAGGTWTVSAGGKRFETTTQPLPDGTEELTLQLVPEPESETLHFSGHVRDRSGKPLHADLTLLRAGDVGQFDQATTDAEGAFAFTRGAPEDYEAAAYVLARSSGYGATGLGPLSMKVSHAGLDIVLDAGRSIGGRIEGLAPGSGAELVLRSQAARFNGAEIPAPGAWLPRALEGESFATGEPTFRIDDLPEGEYELWVGPEDRVQPPARVRVRAGTNGLVVQLGTGLEQQVAIDCLVLDAITGRPVAGASVELLGESGDNPARGSRGRTDAEGRCALLGHVPGRWSAFVKALGYAYLPERYVDYAIGRHALELRLAPACTLDLELVTPDGKPRPQVEVCVTSLDGVLIGLQDRYGHWDGCYARSDIAGRAVLGGLPAGRVRVVLGWKAGAVRAIEEAQGGTTLANLADLLVFELELAPGKHAIVRQVLP